MNSEKSVNQIVIIGGGFFGMYLAERFALAGAKVTLVEQEDAFMTRASYVNQARVHNGYHYPRSILTALRSRVSFPRFVEEFRDAIHSDFDKYYLVANPLGKITGKQFQKFCDRIGAPYEIAPEKIRRLTNPALVEAIFSTVEYAFDSTKLRDLMIDRLAAANVHCRTSTSVESVRQESGGLLVSTRDARGEDTLFADHVFNCTYSRINQVLNNSGLDLIALKHEMTEMCLVTMPDALANAGLTVMCGPFFSAMPFPAVGLHSFSHVRYTPHYEWADTDAENYEDSQRRYDRSTRYTAWRHMQKDATRYIPILADCIYDRSLWEVKTILPRSDVDDSRPILFRPNHGLQGLHCIMGGKIDNVYDVAHAIGDQLGIQLAH